MWLHVEALGDRDEPHASVREVADIAEHVQRRAAPSIQFPNEYGFDFPLACGLHHAPEAGPVVPRAAARLFNVQRNLKAASAGGLPEIAPREAGVLIARRDTVVNRAFGLPIRTRLAPMEFPRNMVR
jgi:hypothetical protein